MSALVYIVAEGVHDVAFIGKLLVITHGASRVKKLEDLDESLRGWLGSAFKWPRFDGKHHDIERLAVPAPVFYRLPTAQVVALRNAQGISAIGKTLEVDLEAFTRAAIAPNTFGVVLDSDDEPADRRFGEMKMTIETLKLVAPVALGEVSAGTPRVGVFALPAPGVLGTLEDVLLALADVAYPDLAAAARIYANEGRQKAEKETTAEWREIKKPSGSKKATIGAMTAVLKPGKSTAVSLEDNRWVCEETRVLACLKPCADFLNALLSGPTPTQPEPLVEISGATS
jgi:hypothetical protein